MTRVIWKGEYWKWFPLTGISWYSQKKKLPVVEEGMGQLILSWNKGRERYEGTT
jgi:hypothetical protein